MSAWGNAWGSSGNAWVNAWGEVVAVAVAEERPAGGWISYGAENWYTALQQLEDEEERRRKELFRKIRELNKWR